MAAMDRALDIRDQRSASFAARVISLLRSPFIRRSVGIMAIGLVNLLVLEALGGVLFVLLLMRTPRAFWRVEFVDSAMNAMLMAFAVLFAAFLVLFRQSLLRRIAAGVVVIFFLLIAIACPGVEHALEFEHLIVFWVCVVMFIPLRALGSWSIHWSDQMPGGVGMGQFSLADLMSWTGAIGVTIAFFRLLGMPKSANGFMFVGFSNAVALTVIYLAAVVAVLIVAGPCLWLAASRGSRFRGSVRVTSWILAVSLVWGVGLLYLDYVYRVLPWSLVVLYSFMSMLYLLSLETVILANLFALEWLGMRWSRPPRESRGFATAQGNSGI